MKWRPKRMTKSMFITNSKCCYQIHMDMDIISHHPKALQGFYKGFEFHGLQNPHEEDVAA